MPSSETYTGRTFTIRELSYHLADRESYDYTVFETPRRIYDNSTDIEYKNWMYVPLNIISCKVVSCSIERLSDEKDLIFDAMVSNLNGGEEMRAKLLVRNQKKLYFTIGDKLDIKNLEPGMYEVLRFHNLTKSK